jgi:hypothetical protein
MKNILFWVDAVLADFCIAKFLQEKIDHNFFAIIESHYNQEKFFHEQPFVKFKKKWFLREILEKKSNVDLEYLKSFEEKYNISLWNIAYSDVIFNNHNEYYKFSRDEILSVLEQECKFFEKVLDEVKPEFLVIRMTDYSQNQLLHQICKRRGIKILILGHTRMGYQCMISSDADTIDNDFELDVQQKGKYGKTWNEFEDFLKGYSAQQGAFREKYKAETFKKLKAALQFLIFVCNNDYRKHYANYGRTRFKVIKNELLISVKHKYRESFLKKKLLKEIVQDLPYVYFPLQLQPERSTLIASPFYTNQLQVIINIAKSLPVGYLLYVKEHPMQSVSNWREISFYKSILDLPNVRFFHQNTSNEKIIKNSSLVITVTGTGSLEAAIYKKPSIVFGDTIYSKLPSVYRIGSYEELPNAIRTSLKRKVDLADLNKFINYIYENSFELDLFTFLYTNFYDSFYHGGFLVDVDIPIKKMELFLEDKREVFEKVALQYIKKIEQGITH